MARQRHPGLLYSFEQGAAACMARLHTRSGIDSRVPIRLSCCLHNVGDVSLLIPTSPLGSALLGSAHLAK